MPSKPTNLTQLGLLPHGYFDQPPQCSSDMDDSQAPIDDDDDADIQDPESTDPSGQMISIDKVQTIGMYANHSRLYLYIYA
jgi:hypothetical protein